MLLEFTREIRTKSVTVTVTKISFVTISLAPKSCGANWQWPPFSNRKSGTANLVRIYVVISKEEELF